MQRNRKAFDASVDDAVYHVANWFGDDGLDGLFRALNERLDACTGLGGSLDRSRNAPTLTTVVPPQRARYLSEISAAIRNYKKETANQVKQASLADGLHRTLMALGHQMTVASRYDGTEPDDATQTLIDLYNSTLDTLSKQDRESIFTMADTRRRYGERITTYQVRGRDVHVESHSESLSGNWIPKVALPQTNDWGEILKWRRLENIPGAFPFTAGVFPFKRAGEDPTRMFAGEGHPERTNHPVSLSVPRAIRGKAVDRIGTGDAYGRDPQVVPTFMARSVTPA